MAGVKLTHTIKNECTYTVLQTDAGANHDDDENGNGNTQGAAELSVVGCSGEQQEVVAPFVDAADEHQATLVEDEDANSDDGAAVVNAAVVNVQVPERATNAQRSEVPHADAPTSRRKGGKRKRTDSETARDPLISIMTKTFEEANRSEEAVEDDISVYVNNMGRKLHKIMDERTLVLIQNEMDQIIFRATMGMYDNQPSQSHAQNTPSPVHRQMQIVTSTPLNRTGPCMTMILCKTLLHLLVSLTLPCSKVCKKERTNSMFYLKTMI